MAYKQPHRNVTPAKQVDTKAIPLPQTSPLMQTHNMTPNASEKESKAVRDKFDKTYMKKEVVDKQPMFVSTELISNKKGKELISNKKEMKDFKLNTQERRDEYTRRNWKQDETTIVKPVTQKAKTFDWKGTAKEAIKSLIIPGYQMAKTASKLYHKYSDKSNK